MARDPRYDILFEPVRIGPLTTRNRFYQVPHCNGMGYRDLSAAAAMREVKAEGGWAVVCTEQAEIHPSSDITPFIELRLWDDRDIPGLARISEAIHRHGALAGIELAYNGMNGPNFYSREVPMGPSHLPIATFTADPVQARAMDKEDIANLRRWHRQAALRARRAGFEIVYVYAAHGFGTVQHFLSRRYNTRTDEYGGSLVNRVRLLRELIEDTREALGETCAVAVRITVDELLGPVGLHKEETAEMIGLIAELPDLWDFTLGGWDNDSGTSRFAEEGYQEPFIAGLKSLTSKPVSRPIQAREVWYVSVQNAVGRGTHEGRGRRLVLVPRRCGRERHRVRRRVGPGPVLPERVARRRRTEPSSGQRDNTRTRGAAESAPRTSGGGSPAQSRRRAANRRRTARRSQRCTWR